MTAKREAEPVLPPRERIIVAAADLFQRQGIRGVGVEAIAEAAGTNKMTLYRHFESKDELIAEWARGIVAQKEALWDELTAKYPDDPRRSSSSGASASRRSSRRWSAGARCSPTRSPSYRIRIIRRACDPGAQASRAQALQSSAPIRAFRIRSSPPICSSSAGGRAELCAMHGHEARR